MKELDGVISKNNNHASKPSSKPSIFVYLALGLSSASLIFSLYLQFGLPSFVTQSLNDKFQEVMTVPAGTEIICGKEKEVLVVKDAVELSGITKGDKFHFVAFKGKKCFLKLEK
jgi:hypothetical protein